MQEKTVCHFALLMAQVFVIVAQAVCEGDGESLGQWRN
jgi:hypothetical protein